jgi:uncharacterized protein YeaO (DUF488 family)
MPVKTKRIYEKAEPGDGCRVLVMRYWPRGISKDKVDVWEKELGTQPDLIELWKSEAISWSEFAQRYRQAVASQKEKIKALAQRAAKDTVTLLCSCPDERRCHRILLKELIDKALLSPEEGGARASRA